MVVLSSRFSARRRVAPVADDVRVVFIGMVLTAGACGTLAPGGAGGSSDLPSSGAGAYHPLPAALERLLDDPVADLADPVLLVDGEALTIYFTRRDEKGGAHIRRTRFETIEKGPSAFDSPLDGDPDGASAPAVLPPLRPGEPWLLCYALSGALGCAGGDGDRFRTTTARAVFPNGAEEGSALSSPALLRLADAPARIGLVYLASSSVMPGPGPAPEPGPSLFLAAAALPATAAEVPMFERVDGRAETPARDPILSPGAAPWLVSIGRTTARTVLTGASRLRHDLFVTGHTAATATGLPALDVVGIAASFDGISVVAAAAPFLAPQKPGRSAPTVAAWRGGSLLLYTTIVGRHSIIAAAAAP